MLIGSRHRERGHDDEEDKQVVDAERILREIAGDELTRVGDAEIPADEHGE